MALHVHRASRADLLADGLGDLLADPAGRPVRRPSSWWCRRAASSAGSRQRLSHRLGAPAGQRRRRLRRRRLPSPARRWSPRSPAPASDDPWAPDALVWPLLAVIDARLDEPWARTLARHLGHGLSGEEGELRRGRRYAVARRLARLFASYAVQRPGAARRLGAGRRHRRGRRRRSTPTWPGSPSCGAGWRPRSGADPPQLRTPRRARAAARGPRRRSTCPTRLSLFGHTRLPVTEVELLGALGEHRDVHLWLPHPSAALWRALAEAVGGPVPRADDDHATERVGHPLLAVARPRRPRAPAHAWRPVADGARPPTVDADAASARTRCSAGSRRDLAPTRVGDRAGARVLAPTTTARSRCTPATARPARSRCCARCCSGCSPTTRTPRAARRPGDVPRHRGLRAADRGRRSGSATWSAPTATPATGCGCGWPTGRSTQTNPLLAVVGPAARPRRRPRRGQRRARPGRTPSRCAAGSASPTTTSSSSTTWVEQAGVRWAFDAEHRADFGLDGYVQNTWRFGLDRLLAGVAMSDDAGRLARTARCRSTTSAAAQVDLAGRLAELVDRLRGGHRRAGRHPPPRPLARRRCATAIDALTAVRRERRAGRPARCSASSAGSADAAGGRGGTELRLPDVRALLADRLGGPAHPRQLPHRHAHRVHDGADAVGAAPRRRACSASTTASSRGSAAVDGDDVLARDPCTGERDPRSEDRQLLLDAVLAATETLVVTYTRRQRVHRPAAPARRTARRAARRARRDRRRGPGRRVRSRHRRAPAPAVRRPQRQPGALVPGRLLLRPRRAGGRPRGRRARARRRRRS